MILLDTNVISEHFRPRPQAAVIAWVDAQPANEMYICTPVLAELRFGAERLDPGRRQTELHAAIDRLENTLYHGRILAFDPSAAAHYGRIAAMRERMGRRIGQMDGLIAAIAVAHGAALATRDERDFAGLGFEVINPFAPA
jgi:predicted nucleic acid-binding protein